MLKRSLPNFREPEFFERLAINQRKLSSCLARFNEHAVEPVRLENNNLIALRDVWVHLSRDEQRTMGAKIGANIELRTITYMPNSQRPED